MIGLSSRTIELYILQHSLRQASFPLLSSGQLNSLPRTVTDSDTLGTFKSNLKTFMFCQAFNAPLQWRPYGAQEMWLLLPAGLPRSGKLPVLNLLTGQKSGFFVPQGRPVAPIHNKLGLADGHMGPFGCAKFHLNRRSGVGMWPKNIKKCSFW